MRKKLLIILIGIFLVGTIIAGDIVINNFTKEKFIDKEILDYIKENSKVDDINIKIEIKCSEDKCKWDAFQKGVINSKNNPISKYEEYCIKEINTKEGWYGCEKWGERELTIGELEDKVSNLISNRLTERAINDINKEQLINKSKGNLKLTSKGSSI